MFFTLKELVRWFRMTAFEIWVHLVTIFVFSIFAVLKQEDVLNISWWETFIPLFVGDGLNTYFCVIVFIRQYQDDDFRPAGIRLLISLLCLSLLFVFKFLLCQKLNDENSGLTHTEVIAPLFPLLVILSVRSCQVQ